MTKDDELDLPTVTDTNYFMLFEHNSNIIFS